MLSVICLCINTRLKFKLERGKQKKKEEEKIDKNTEVGSRKHQWLLCLLLR